MFDEISQKVNIEQQTVIYLPKDTLIDLCDSIQERIVKERETYYDKEWCNSEFCLIRNLIILSKTLKEIPIPYSDYKRLINF